jgi:hypothetical protein
MNCRLIFFFLLITQFAKVSANGDSICGTALRYQALKTKEPTDGFFWIAGDHKYNVYFKGADFILEQKSKHKLWLITGNTFNPYPNQEMHIDSVYFKNTSESAEKELVVNYSLFSMRPDNSGKSRHMMVIDLRDKIMLLNIALYDHKLQKDENGKYTEYLYECDIDLYHDSIRVTTTDDSDIDNALIQLDDGVYVRKGHCFVTEK